MNKMKINEKIKGLKLFCSFTIVLYFYLFFILKKEKKKYILI